MARRRSFILLKEKNVEISKIDIEKFIIKYVELRYTWDGFDPRIILKNISPVTTKELLHKIEKKIQMDIKKQNKSKGKTKNKNQIIEQTVTNINPLVSKKQSLASFDRIIRINDLSLISPAQVSFRIVRGKPNVWNPIGLYVDGMTMHETK